MCKKRSGRRVLYLKTRKTALPDSPKTRQKLEKLPRIWYVGYWAHYGTRHEVLGGFDRDGHPLVWYFDDHNGEYSEWQLTRLEYTTTGVIITWTDEDRYEKMKKIADLLEADLIKRQQEMRKRQQEKLAERISHEEPN